MSLPAKLLIAAPMSLLALSLATPADAFFSKSGHKHRAHVLPDNFTLRKKNATLTLHGKAKTEYADSHYPVFLNKNYPDEYNYFKTTLDLSSNFAWGRKKFGYNAVDASLVLRHKSYWGEAGRTNITDENQTKVCDSLMKAHSHESSKPVVWIKEAWLSTTLNAWGDLRTKNKQTIKAGFFPFKIGRGISLGDSYGTAYKFLAIYSKNNDFSPAGILFSGTILKDRLDYDFYYGLLENKSTTVEQTFNHKKANHIGRNDPWSGSGRDNEVFAGQLHYKHDLGKRGNVVANPYIMYNRALDQKIEFDADSKSELGTMGVGFEYSR
ncbi:hypothetical protein HOD08_00420, partial [bacterium]|nr:hypothetical protein [bacterium]